MKRLKKVQRDKLIKNKERLDQLNKYCGICSGKKRCSFCKFNFEKAEVQRTINRFEAVQRLNDGENIMNINKDLKNGC